jgi:hypothetical protein
MTFVACLILSSLAAFPAFGWLVSIFIPIPGDPANDVLEDYPTDFPWPVDWEQFP